MVVVTSRLRHQVLAGWALLFAATLAPAQGASPSAGRPDPLDPQARVPATIYRSPLAGFGRLGDDKRVPWQEANATVNRIGGWRTYAREAQQPEPAASAPGSGAAASAGGGARGHGGHGKH